jgi:hypothetical protein
LIRFARFASLAALAAAGLTACGAGPQSESGLETVTLPVSVPKAYTRKIYVHLMPWFQKGGQHWAMKARNPATGVASWYKPLIGEYSSNDANVIEYQLLTMKYAGIDGVIIDWPGLSKLYDLPQNKANSDAIINKTAAFGLEFGICYEDFNAKSEDAAKADMVYVRDSLITKPNYIHLGGAPMVMVFGPQSIDGDAAWSNVLSVFPTSPSFFALAYNNKAGGNADGKFNWIQENGIRGALEFDQGQDGTNHGQKIPVVYPGFNTWYEKGGWDGPRWKVSFTLNADGSEGGNTMQSTFELGKTAGEALQIATWNDYGEGTMVEPTAELQYQSLTTLQKSLGVSFTDKELKVVKLLFDERRQTNGSQQAQLDMASAALANLDVATACAILNCDNPPTGSAGASGATGTAGTTAAGGAASTAGGAASTAGGAKAAAGFGADEPQPIHPDSACAVSAVGGVHARPVALLFAAIALAFGAGRRKRRAAA